MKPISKQHSLFLLLIIFFNLFTAQTPLYCKDIPICGTIVCDEDKKPEYRKTAKYAIVWPEADVGEITLTDGSGFYRVCLPFEKICDKRVVILVLEDWKNHKVFPETTYVSIEDIKREGKIIMPTSYIKDGCDKVEFSDYALAKSIMEKIQGKQVSSIVENNGNVKIKKAAKIIRIKKTLWVLGAVSVLTSIYLLKKNDGLEKKTRFDDVARLHQGKSVDGKILPYLISSGAGNLGFWFAPTHRNSEDAVFGNPSSLSFFVTHKAALNFKLANLGRDEYKFIGKTSLFFSLKKNWKIGLGVVALRQREKRVAILKEGSDFIAPVDNDEILFTFSISKTLNRHLSLGIAGKSYIQFLNTPVDARIIDYYKNDELVSTESFLIPNRKVNHVFDFDLSLTFELSSSINIGGNLMNVLGNKPKKNEIEYIGARGLGAGISYTYRRFHIGADFILFENEKPSFSLGTNLVPSNDVKLRIGYSTLFNTFSVGGSFKYFGISYNRNRVFGGSFLVGISINL